ncbi:heme ABC transporter ATP-binding protein [Natronomonas halophila]|uniref:heme ABC transporter ATP-binding protein n=1 Tax=Natronomonas halophila TaxID=2747817 RepID=UPI0015B60A2E|nr:heme ABC transporter ATP-binding protein [Natronomonas halophila]QLD84947.1 heme ABC transporter ATP-binding protein [Natronomonas halophila]
MISLDGVGISFGATTVLDGVSLEVPEGQFLALVGPNGAGKTTLLRTINGLLTPDRGRVTVDGEDVTNLSTKEVGRRVATVPQETSVAFEFDVEDVVSMGRTPHRSRFTPADTADREAVEAALERTDTTRFADRSVDDLSGGERQRVLLARALAQETPVLLLDEPTASLDINHQVRTLSLARELVDEGKTVVAAIHDLELAARFCDAMALLADGEIVAVGPPEEVLSAERLETAFGVRTAVATNPVTGTRSVTPLSDAPPGDRRVHVIGGGERTARVVGRLVDSGIDVTVGILPEGDAAVATARSVASDVVTAPPFESVPKDRTDATRDLVSAADVTVLAAPVDGANATVARVADPLVALPGTDPPEHARMVDERDLMTSVRDPPKSRSSRTQQ